MQTIYHALVLNLHQPAGNLEYLLDTNPWEAKEILYAMDRIPRALWDYEDLARVHLSLSGTLLETLASPAFQQRVYGMVDLGSLLWYLQNRKLFSILGTGYYHPVLPLIPFADRTEQLLRWQGIAQHLFWRKDFAGFWPPEMGFSMELIPLIRYLGYRYVLVDSEHVEAITPMSWHELRYRPHVAHYGGKDITIIVRDRELSNAQEAGHELSWFKRELAARTQFCDFPPLVTTASDGDNGGWFRNTNSMANFWSFYQQLLDEARQDKHPIRPTFIEDYLDQHGTWGEVWVRSGAWNTGWHHGLGFSQWTGSDLQRNTLASLHEISQAIHDARWRIGESFGHDANLHHQIEQALWHLLRAETSCNFYWGETWVSRAQADLAQAWELLNTAKAEMDARSS
jgi:alpha-amylase/alpha-mannosidase (GH57 family)